MRIALWEPDQSLALVVRVLSSRIQISAMLLQFLMAVGNVVSINCSFCGENVTINLL